MAIENGVDDEGFSSVCQTLGDENPRVSENAVNPYEQGVLGFLGDREERLSENHTADRDVDSKTPFLGD